MENIFVEFLPPWVETGLQPAFYDKESGTVLQQTARMYARVNMLIRMFNKLSKNTKTEVERFEEVVDSRVTNFENSVNETVADYIEQFNELHDYVHDYFDNLDVQEEINNKLDQMLEDGVLQEIITTYVQSNVAWTFDTVANMKAATNFINGSFAHTLGYSTLNDGGGAFYKVRNIGENETADEKMLIAITGTTLVAELITTNQVNACQVGANTDFVGACNYLIQGGYDIYVPEGNYTADDTILFDKNRTRFECDGNIECTDEFTLFKILAQKVTLNLNGKVTGYVDEGTRKDVLLTIGGTGQTTSASYNKVFVKEALTFNEGIFLNPNGGYGTSYNNITFTHLQANIGIHLKGGDDGANWINENTFNGGRLEPVTYGIFFENGGPSQSDPYNGNKFYHIAIEPASTYQVGIKMEYGQHNYFEQMRLSEGVSTGYYVELDAGVTYNTFNNCSRVSITKFVDHNTDPKYYNHFQFSGIRDEDWHMLARECYTVGGTIFVPDGEVMNIPYFFGEGNNQPLELYGNLTCNRMTIRVGVATHNTDMVYTLPNSFGAFGVTEFIVRITWKGNNCSFTFNWPDGTLAIPDSAFNYQNGNDRFLCRYVNTGSDYSGTWIVQPLQ